MQRREFLKQMRGAGDSPEPPSSAQAEGLGVIQVWALVSKGARDQQCVGVLLLPLSPCICCSLLQKESAIHSRTFYVPDTGPGVGDPETNGASLHLPGIHSLIGEHGKLRTRG